jgi:capsular exopolysaccharide synthesis family protein
MGNMFEALKKAEEERERLRASKSDGDGKTEIEVVARARKAKKETPDAGFSELIVVADNPEGAEAEQFRAARNNLISLLETPFALAVTSAVKGEGKTLVSVNLGVALAEADKGKVLIIDANLRSPGLAKLLGVREVPGLSDVIMASMDPMDAVLKTRFKCLDVMPAGSPADNPGQLVYHGHIGDIVAKLKNEYPMILLDAPPAVSFADAGIIGKALSGAILVVGVEKVERKTTERALEGLESSGVRVVGTIVTNSRRVYRT